MSAERRCPASWAGLLPYLLALSALSLLGKPLGAAPQDAFQRPKYKFLRQNEDWSDLSGRDTDSTGDSWDSYKFVPLSDDGSIWASFGGSVRTRFEGWRDFNFGRPPGVEHDDEILMFRLMAHADVHIGEPHRVYAEVKHSGQTDRDLPGGNRTLDVDDLDLQQAFYEWTHDVGGHGDVKVRPGRQMLSFGKQRLVSPLAWSNTLRTWDGITVDWHGGTHKVTGFWTQFVPVDKYDLNEADTGQEFFGIYAADRGTDAGGHDLYWLTLDRDAGAFNGTGGHETRHTIGGRIWKPLGHGLDYEFEGAFQTGSVGGEDVSAFMATGQIGYLLEDLLDGGRAYVGVDYASGDDDPGDEVETFNQLFPLSHAYLGYIDAIGRQNIIDLNAGASALLGRRWNLAASAHNFWLASDDDALYNAGGAVSVASGSTDSSNVGLEIDLTAKCAINQHTSALLGYSHFFAGDVIEDSTSDDDIDFLYVSLQYTF